MTRRRHLLRLAAVALVPAGRFPAEAAPFPLRHIDLNRRLKGEEAETQAGRFRIDQSEAAPTTDLRPFSAEPGIPNWTSLPKAERQRLPVSWTTDQAESADRAFLPNPFTAIVFRLRASVLADWARNNAIPLGNRVLFGIRGSALHTETTDWTDWVELSPADPDHIHNRCTIGVLDVKAGRLVAYQGSTVPNVNWMYQQVKAPANSCNMLPTGQYLYRSGRHGRYPGCFRLNEAIFTRRAYDRLNYRVTSWGKDVGNPGCNIHLGFFDQSTTPAYYSSAGCQTTKGGWSMERWEYARSFAAFRVAAGQPASIPRGAVALPTDGQAYAYCLIDFADLALTAVGQGVVTRRQGSTSPEIPALRTVLAESVPGVPSGSGPRFDGNLTRLTVQWQTQSGRAPTGVISAEEAQTLGIRLPTRSS